MSYSYELLITSIDRIHFTFNIQQNYFTHQTSIVFKGHAFQLCMQLPDESVAAHVTKFKCLSEEWKFKRNLSKRLSDQFASSIANEDIQRQLKGTGRRSNSIQKIASRFADTITSTTGHE